jgi:hypothetical protein
MQHGKKGELFSPKNMTGMTVLYREVRGLRLRKEDRREVDAGPGPAAKWPK